MKVYVIPYGKDTKVYASREAAEKARDRIAYNIEMSGSNNPTPPVIETDVLDESLNESTDKEDSLDDYGNEPNPDLLDII